MNAERSVAAVPALILLPAAVFFTAVSDLLHPLLLLIVLLIGVSLIPLRLRFNDRTMIYLILLALLLALGGDKLWPLRHGRFHFMVGLLFPSLLVPFGFYLTALSVLFRRRDVAAGMAVGAAWAALLLTADPRTLEPQFFRVPFLAGLLRNHGIVFPALAGYTLLVQLLTMRHIYAAGRSVRREMVALLAIFLVCGGAWISIRSYHHFRNNIRGWERILLNLGSGTARRPGEWVFSGNRIRLSETLAPERRGLQGGDVVFQVTGPFAPGYLRGNIYSVYRNGGWEFRDLTAAEPVPMLDTGEELVLESRFSFGEVRDYP
ncbi:MAG: hypothetical protein J6R85_03720, partial [Lentisphaeria bacterium]|nr:hypothetical protein [Lentisphaeria bacterium]